MGQAPPELFYICAKDIAAICHVDLATARRWKRGTTCAPPSALMVLRRDLGAFDPAWAGWRVLGETIYSPDGSQSTLADVRALPMLRASLTTYRAENRQLRESLAQVAFVDEQPQPHEIPAEVLAQIK